MTINKPRANNSLINARKKAGLTQGELAKITGLMGATISRLETLNRSPRKSTAETVASALCIPVESIFPEVYNGPVCEKTSQSPIYRAIIKKHGSIGAFAKELGIPIGSVYRYISLERSPEDQRARLIAEKLDKPVDYLFPRYRVVSREQLPRITESPAGLLKNIIDKKDSERQRDLREALGKAISHLSDYQQQEILVLHYIDGYSLKEIGDMFGKNKATISLAKIKALKILQEHYSKDLECFLYKK